MNSGINLNYNNMNMNNNNIIMRNYPNLNYNNINMNSNNMIMNNDPNFNNNMNINMNSINNNTMLNNTSNLGNMMNMNINMNNNIMVNNSCNNNMNNFFNMKSINALNNNSKSFNNFNQNSGICINNILNNVYNNNNLNMNTSYIINNNNYFGSNTLSLIDCFEFYQKINHMSGENQMYCNYCRKNTDCYMRTILTEGPEVLILLLNRGKGIEFDIKIEIGESIDLSHFFTKEKNCIYDLIGVITHFGESSMSGNFIAYCIDPLNNKNWIKYNDSVVTDVDSNNFQKEVIDFGMPYLLFYQKSK